MLQFIRAVIAATMLPVIAWGASSASTTLNLSIVSFYECSDGYDNDGDGYTDFPDDPDCAGLGDSPESGSVSSNPIDYPEGAPTSGSGTSSSTISDGARSVVATETSGENKETLHGKTFPYAEVVLYSGGVILEGEIADENGDFVIEYFHDRYRDISVKAFLDDDTSTSMVEVSEGQMTYLPPLIESLSVNLDSGVVLDGMAIPDTSVEVKYLVDGLDLVSEVINVGLDGTYLFEGTFLPDAQDGYWVVLPADEMAGEEGAIYYSVPKGDFDSGCFLMGDVNDDCRVNLSDYSIAAFWYKKTLSTHFLNIEAVKLSNDAEVNLSDFSIMAYFWTG